MIQSHRAFPVPYLAMASLLALAAQVMAEPSQVPLTARSATPPAPNLMLTLDDSGSMLFDFMPEESFKVNGTAVKLATSVEDPRFWPVGYPNDPRRSVTKPSGTYSYIIGGVVTALGPSGGATIFERQYRSPDVNAVYYNPDIQYKPWKDAGALPADMAAATYNNARYDPQFSSSSRLNLSKSVVTSQLWCKGFKDCLTSPGSATFNPAIVYRLTKGADPTKPESYTYYNLNNPSNYAAANSHPDRKDCDPTGKGAKCSQALEQQNFANWFTYYRLRETMTKAALGRSLVEYENKIRVGWSQFNYADNGVVTTGARVQRGVQAMNAAKLKQVLTDIYKIGSFNGTPIRLVLDDIGAYFKKTDDDNPWLTTPGVTEKDPLSCRRSANFLLTDGYYNDTYSAAGDQDNTNGTAYTGTENPDGYTPDHYVAELPYSDGPTKYSNTLSDVAIQYYKTDLQPGIRNRVPPVEGDIAFWQHLTQFTVGLGVTGTLDSSSEAAKRLTLAKIKAGTLTWPDPGPTANSAQKIDDLWHAAVTTGGDFYSVKNTTELSKAMNDAIGKAVGNDAREAGVALSSSSKISGTYKFVPKYRAVAWNGDLEAYTIDAKGVASPVPAWVVSSPTGGLTTWSSRNLLVWDRGAGGTWNGAAKEFTWSTMGSQNQAAIVTKRYDTDAAVDGEKLTNWARGDTTNEGAGNLFRSRAGKRFGDFVNAPPVYVRDQVDLGYTAIQSSYATYITNKNARTVGVVFAGSNDGMLHAFRSDNGVEVMGYLPAAGLAKQNIISRKDYGTTANFHQFIVDGPHVESDAYITNRRSPSTPEWTNVLVGTMGAGGTGIYALHIPTLIDASNPLSLDAKTVLWERSAVDDADGDIGYMMGEIAVGKIQGEKSASSGWKVFVGNGVDSKSGRSVLLVIDLATGAIDKITLDSGTGNGALGVSLLKNDKGEVYAGYVGDLQGKLWRVEFPSADASSWAVGFSGKPLVQALTSSGSAQAITSAPLSMPFKKGEGQVVVFGTGRLLTETDADDTTVQTVYGVLDPTAEGSSSVTSTTPFDGLSNLRTKLQVRTVEIKTGTDITYHVISGSAIDWLTQLGWYFEMPKSRQRMVYPAIKLFDDYVFLQTVIPAQKAAECDVSVGSGVNYVLQANDGLQPTEAMIDTNGDGVIDGDDALAGGWEGSGDGTDDLVVPPDTECKDGYRIAWDFSTDPKGIPVRLKCEPPTEAPKIVDRVWREIVNPPQPSN